MSYFSTLVILSPQGVLCSNYRSSYIIDENIYKQDDAELMHEL